MGAVQGPDNISQRDSTAVSKGADDREQMQAEANERAIREFFDGALKSAEEIVALGDENKSILNCTFLELIKQKLAALSPNSEVINAKLEEIEQALNDKKVSIDEKLENFRKQVEIFIKQDETKDAHDKEIRERINRENAKYGLD